MEEYAKGGTIKPKKVRAKKAKPSQTIIKKGNVKQIVNIKLGEKVIRRPSARAKAIGRENIPIRPGVSSYPITNQPSYERMIPSTGAITIQSLPQTSTDIVPTSQTLAKSDILSSTIKPSTVDILRKSEIGRQAAVVGQKRIDAGQARMSDLFQLPPRKEVEQITSGVRRSGIEIIKNRRAGPVVAAKK
jgi:hypothetical protein